MHFFTGHISFVDFDSYFVTIITKFLLFIQIIFSL